MTARRTILVVDDDPIGTRMVQFLLSEQGYEVDTVDNARGAMALIERRTPDLMLLDVNLPQLSGFEMYEAIRGESRGLSVLFMSGFPAPHFRKTVGQDPHVAFVTKPWTASGLLAQVRALLGGQTSF